MILSCVVTLPLATAARLGLDGSGALVWWQVVGALAAVLALLLVCLRLLGRLQIGPRSRDAALVAVWPLGPRREIQLLRLGDQLHYIYRHESALVLLRQQSWAEYQDQLPSQPEPQRWLGAIRDRLQPEQHAAVAATPGKTTAPSSVPIVSDRPLTHLNS